MKTRKLIYTVLLLTSLVLFGCGVLLALLYGDKFKQDDFSAQLFICITCFILGSILFGLTLGLLLTSFFKKDPSESPSYFDERQVLISGKGYKYSCFTMIGCGIAILLYEAAGLPAFATSGALLWFCIILGLLVRAIYSIWNEAYFAVNASKKATLLPLSILGIILTFSGIDHILDGKLLENGLITWYIIFPLYGITILLVWITVGIKALKERKDEDA